MEVGDGGGAEDEGGNGARAKGEWRLIPRWWRPERARWSDALEAGPIIAVPGVGGYSLAVRAGSPEAETRLVELAADPDGPHFAVGHNDGRACADLGVDRRAGPPARTLLARPGRSVRVRGGRRGDGS